MAQRYFDDFEIGETFRSAGVTLSESQILDFALVYDPQPFHIDSKAAEDSHFGGLIASGFQTLALGFRMFYQEGSFAAAAIGSPGMDELRWHKPVRPGDTLRTEAEILEKRPSRSKPDRGTLRVAFAIINQMDDVVMTFLTTVLVRRGGD